MCPFFCNFAAAKLKAANLRFGGEKNLKWQLLGRTSILR